MATLRTSATGGGTTGTGNRTATIVPAVGDLLVVFCAVSVNSNDTPTCTDDNGGTYDLISVGNWTSTVPNDYRLAAFVRTALMVNTTSTVVTPNTGSNNSGVVVVLAITGMTKTGLAAILQEGGQDAQSGGTTPAPALPGSALTTNLTISAVGSWEFSADDPAPPASWTEQQDTGTTAPEVALSVATRDSGFTGTTITWGGNSSVAFSSMAIELNTSAVDPPPVRRLAATLALLLMAWQPMQPAQPARVDIAPTIETVTADAPPPQDRRNLTRIIGQWWKPVRHGTSGSAPPAVDEVPPSRPRLEQILAQWTPAAPMPPRPRVFTPGYAPDAPPPVTRSAVAAITQASWIPPPGLPPRAPLLVPITSAASADDPPFDARRPAYKPIYSAWKWRAVGSGDAGPAPQADPVPPVTRHPEILASWTPALALPQLRLRSVPQADTFPPAPSQRPEILSSWTPALALPQMPRSVATLPGVSVDPPPPTGTATTLAIVRAAWLPASGLPQRAPQLVPAVVNDPPFARKPELRPMLSAWQPAPEQVVYVSRLVFEYSPDDPPPSVLAGRLARMLRAWLPGLPAAQWSRHVPPSDAVVPAVNDPPFDSRRAALGPIYSSWKWRPVGSGDTTATPPVVNDPPFGQRSWLPTALAAWQPGPPPSQSGAHVPVSVAAVPVNDPPPLTRQPLAILSAWQPLPALPPERPGVVQEAAAPAVDNPPPSARPLTAILSSWQPAPTPSQRAPQTPQVAADVADVPPTARPWLGPVLAGWQAPTLPQPPRPWLASLPGASVDAPPIQRPPSLAIIRAAWEPPAPLPMLPVHLAQERPPDAPPFGLRSWLPATLRAWQPGPPAAQWGRHLPVVVTHVPVDNPPFGIRPWLPTVRALWIPGPPQPITRPIVATESGPSTQIPLLVVTAIRVQRAHADEVWVTPARATATRVVRAHADEISDTQAMATAPRIQRAHATNIRIFGG